MLARDAGMDFFDWLSAVDQPDADPPGVDVVLHVADSSSFGAGGRAGPPVGPPDRRMLLAPASPTPTSGWPASPGSGPAPPGTSARPSRCSA